MKYFWIACIIATTLVVSALGEITDQSELIDMAPEARFISFNTSSSSSTLTLLGAVILLGVIFYLVYVGDLFSPAAGYNRNGYDYQNDYAQYDNQYAQYRSSKSGYNFNALNIIQWISMLQDVYEKFDMNDLECQKRLVCEITREPEYFGTFSRSARSGFKYANTLAHMVTLPDDINELLDEYTDASNTGESSKKECEEYFQCPYSIKDSIKRNLVGNDL